MKVSRSAIFLSYKPPCSWGGRSSSASTSLWTLYTPTLIRGFAMDSSPVIVSAGTLSHEPLVLSPWQRVTGKLRSAPLISLGIMALLVFTAVFADFLAPHNPEVG